MLQKGTLVVYVVKVVYRFFNIFYFVFNDALKEIKEQIEI